jgi:DNA helicase II / ATP-dependent DNA helicase PcrA
MQMPEYQHNLQEENSYLAKTLDFIQSELDSEAEVLADKKRELIALRKDMSDNTVPSLNEFERRIEIYQYLDELSARTAGYGDVRKRLAKYQKILGTPYFARIDMVVSNAGELTAANLTSDQQQQLSTIMRKSIFRTARR